MFSEQSNNYKFKTFHFLLKDRTRLSEGTVHMQYITHGQITTER